MSTIEKALSYQSQKSTFRTFLNIFLPVALIVIAGSIYLYIQEKHHRDTIIKQFETQQVELQKNLIVNELNPVMSDLFYLENLVQKNSYLSTNSKQHLQELVNSLLVFSEKKSSYRRIQIVNNEGVEKINIFHNQGVPLSLTRGGQAPESSKGVRESLALNKENIYISEFHQASLDTSLGVSPNGHVLTFGIPIFSENGQRLGAVILQYTVQKLVSHLKKISVQSDSDWFLINQEGEQVFQSEKPGFVEVPFSEIYPDAWHIIQERIAGQFRDAHGLFTFASIFPDSESREFILSTSKAPVVLSRMQRQAIQNPWKLISFLPEEKIENVSHRFLVRLFYTNIVLMIMLAGLSWGLAIVVVKRKEAEQALKYREIEYRDLFENAPNGILTLDSSGKILRANRRVQEISGIPRKDIVGSQITDFFLKITPAKAEVQKLLKRLAAGEEVNNEQLEIEKPNGQKGWISISVSAILTDQSELIGQRISIIDISQQKLLEKQLQQSLKMEAIGRLSGGIAHDFNNLLTVMAGYMDLIQKQFDKKDPLYDDLEQVCKAIERASALTQQLLAFSRRQIVEPKIINFNDIIRNLEKMLRRILGEDIEFHADLAKDLGNVMADPAQIEQIIMNLVVNARDAMPEGGILTIETANVDLDAKYASTHMGVEPGSYVMLSVSDTGIGMDEKTIAHIYEPFFSTKKEGMGTGLGLSMVYGAVRQNKGTIWVYSEPGKGTTFKIYLPRAEKDVDPIQKNHFEFENLKGSETILLVEDEEAVRKLAKRYLEENGYTVLAASNGAEALDIAKKAGPSIDLMVTDVIMPGMSGKELYKRISEFIPNLRVLYISGYTDNAIVHYGVLEPGTNFLQKPFKPDTLLMKIRQTLQKKNG